MDYRFRAGPTRLDTRAFNEKAYRRESLPPWEIKWNELSPAARKSFLRIASGATTSAGIASRQSGVPAHELPRDVVNELKDAGLAETEISHAKGGTERMYVAAAAHDFAARMGTLCKHKLLTDQGVSALAGFVKHSFYEPFLISLLTDVLRKAGIGEQIMHFGMIERHVARRHWPGWVADTLDDSLVRRVLEAVRAGGSSMRLAELITSIKGSTPMAVRATVEQLVSYLALVEDLEPETSQLLVGFPASVRDDMIRASKPAERPPLSRCEKPKEFGPDSGIIVDDLRAVLLEIAATPPRIRQDRGLFEKESDRFDSSLEPVPLWLLTALKWHHGGRVGQALTWARGFRMVKVCSEGKRMWLELSPHGQTWLSGSIEEQYRRLYDFMRTSGKQDDVDAYLGGFAYPGMLPFDSFRPGDMRFFGEYAGAVKVDGQSAIGYHATRPGPDDERELREHVDRALSVLEPGAFYRLDSVARHVVFGQYNPLNRGRSLDKVNVSWALRPVPAIEEEREFAGRQLIESFVFRRLIPLGCVRTAIDEEGQICIARVPRYDAYFGRQIDDSSESASSASAVKVVVQPDFTVILIGTHSGPLAELAPFCERTTRGNAHGATTLKITRESVIKAVSGGLKPEEIALRLERHATKKAPANVLRQVRDWSSWVRLVTASRRILVRCPDSDSADRIMAVLKGRAERLASELVAIPIAGLNERTRKNLRASGIIVEDEYDRLGE